MNITQALRQAADLLEQHPNLPRPYITGHRSGRVELNWFLNGRDELDRQKESASEIVRTIGGTWSKNTDTGLGFSFTQTRGLLEFFVSVDRSAVCERVVVGTEERTIPAVEAQPERTEIVEKVEWRCQSLLSPGEHQQAEQHAAVAS